MLVRDVVALPMGADGAFPAEREQDVTASEVGTLWGAGYVSRWELWQRHAKGLARERKVTRSIMAGKMLEAGAAELIADRYDLDITKATVYLRSPSMRLGATPDYIYRTTENPGGAPLEVKVVSDHAFALEWAGGTMPPLRFQLQAAVQAALLGSTEASVGVLVGGVDPFIFPLRLEFAVWQEIQREVSAFWLSVAEGTEPAPDFKAEAGVILAVLRQVQEKREADLRGDGEFASLCAQIAGLRQQRLGYERAAQGLAEVADALMAQVVHKVGDAALAMGDGYVLQRAVQHRKGYTVEPTSYTINTVLTAAEWQEKAAKAAEKEAKAKAKAAKGAAA